MVKCKKCHKDLDSQWKVCPFCGTKVAAANTPNKKRPRRGNGQGGAYKRGKTWTARVTVGWRVIDGFDVPVYRTKGGFKTKTEALAYCPTLAASPVAVRNDVSFEKLYLQWKDGYTERVSASTMGCYTAAYRHFKPLYHRPFGSLVSNELQDCLDKCPSGKRTKENMKALLSLLYKYAMHNDITDRNRAETLYTGNEAKGTRPAFTDEELLSIYQAYDPYAPYVVCMCYLGYRPGEMLALKREAYDPVHRCLVGGSKTKAGIDRIVTIPEGILPYVEARYNAGGTYLFPNLKNGRPMSDNYFRSECFDPLMASLGIEGKVPYSCRHTFANMLKNVQGSDTDKAALIGHADASMTKYYQSADYNSLSSITAQLKMPKS